MDLVEELRAAYCPQDGRRSLEREAAAEIAALRTRAEQAESDWRLIRDQLADASGEIARLTSYRNGLAQNVTDLEGRLEAADAAHRGMAARLAESGRALKAIADWPAHVTHEEWERLRKIAHDAVYGVDERSTPSKQEG